MVPSRVALLWDSATTESGTAGCKSKATPPVLKMGLLWSCQPEKALQTCADGIARAPDVDDFDDELRLCCGHAGQEMDLGDPPCFIPCCRTGQVGVPLAHHRVGGAIHSSSIPGSPYSWDFQWIHLIG